MQRMGFNLYFVSPRKSPMMSAPSPSKAAPTPSALVWFRNDLRLSDHPALATAAKSGKPVTCIYIVETNASLRPLGGASRWWLHHSLKSLEASLGAIGGRLLCYHGDSEQIVSELVQRLNIDEVHWSRRYGGAERDVDARLKADLKARGVAVESHNGSLLHEPWQVLNKSNEPYKVFTPFWRACLAGPAPERPLPAPEKIVSAAPDPGALSIDALNLLPTKPNWAADFHKYWHVGESAARQRLEDFITNSLTGYGTLRDVPDAHATSRLSPHLRFGEISPREIFYAVQMAREADKIPAGDASKFLAEIGWREFSYALLFHNPHLATRNFVSKFDAFEWSEPKASDLEAWQRGRTGYPIVDAGLRELWSTGVMHNRVRMIVASFLIKHLMIDWRVGEQWFWDTLCDADTASNAASWQWVAGSGADAAPYYRIFNPIIQGEKFDPEGAYVRKFVPELKGVAAKHIHKPWELSSAELRSSGVELGKTYPHPIVDHGFARIRALNAFQALSKS